MNQENQFKTIQLSTRKFVLGCGILSLAILGAGNFYPLSSYWIAIELFLTVVSIFVFGSIQYRLNKNAITYGAALVMIATFWGPWWLKTPLRQSVELGDYKMVFDFVRHTFFSLHGLDQLVHADTMLFILGLTLFVSVIAQTRLLETVSFAILRRNRGGVIPTIATLTALVAFSSGILDGVSMIGLMIRILVIILLLSKAKNEAVLYVVMVSTVVTTVCGIWLAYGEPPNLIMKANLHPHLDNTFFLRYCLPIAMGSYIIVVWNVRKRLRSQKIEINQLDLLDLYMADVRFLQASRHGEVLTPIGFVEEHEELIAPYFDSVLKRLHKGEPLGSSMIREKVPENIRRELLGKFVSEELAETLDCHYQCSVAQNGDTVNAFAQKINLTLKSIRRQRIRSQWIGGISFFPFVGLLVWHTIDHRVPLFLASFAGFVIASIGILLTPKMRQLALKEAKHEYMEYLFLFPLFLSIALLQKTGFFNQISAILDQGIKILGTSHVAYLQFVGTTFLSAILDNNIVADFSSRALQGLESGILYLFAMAQIAGYAIGGCWTHIGSAQSVVAYAFIHKEIDEHFTPFKWIQAMTPVILEIFLLITFIVYGEGLILSCFSK